VIVWGKDVLTVDDNLAEKKEISIGLTDWPAHPSPAP
jgi:hypothetical protein